MSTSVPHAEARKAHGPVSPLVSSALARRVVDDAVRRYFAKRREKVPGFIATHYSLLGALRMHRRALGHDLWRAPLNAALVGPALALKGAAWVSDKAGRAGVGRWLRAREIFLRTDVARALEWRLLTELLELPAVDANRISKRDALADEILADKRLLSVLSLLDGPWGAQERERLDVRLRETIAIYTNNRFAIAEIANMGLTAGVGAAVLHQATPGIWTLGPALAGFLTTQLAAAQIPTGLAAGAAAAAAAPVVPGAALTVATTAAVMSATAAVSAVSGVVTDPLQKLLGLHERRLMRMLEALERAFLGADDAAFVTRDEYVMRVAELVDMALSAWRFARG